MTDSEQAQPEQAGSVELSIVLPCLNERETLAACVRDGFALLERAGVSGEVIVADNGSTDGSDTIATESGARLVRVAERGYGAAILGGIRAANGTFVLIADADQSYSLLEGDRFLERLRAGADLVVGSRLRGEIRPGAMPWKNRWIGNPLLSLAARVLFRCPVSDFHCGMRAVRREGVPSLDLRTTGMEFATEMIVKARLRGLVIEEEPITFHPDQRSGAPHLRPWRDGWRHLRFMILLSPLLTLIAPGLLLGALGIVLGVAVAAFGVRIGSAVLGPHTFVGACLMVIVGYEAVTVGIAARVFALQEELGPPSRVLPKLLTIVNLERGLAIGALTIALGVALIAVVAWRWAERGFGPLPLERTIVPMLSGATLVTLGVQTLLMSVFYSMLGIPRRGSS